MMWIQWPRVPFMGYSSCANEEEKVFRILKVNVKKERERVMSPEEDG